ncbi:MAG: LysM peptidoglycan-binding domain-containing protein [Brevefilum sp.]|nr:LysM peptidoglycan-binding domain-containing protein [Brevefilum sp.]
MRQIAQFFLIAVLALTLVGTAGVQPVSAQAGSAADLINAVNALRQGMGLAPYTVDSYLMGFAQTHSNYMASIGQWTHTRADGTTATQYGIKENVAMGTNMSIQYCIYTVWSDWVHWQTMTTYATGKVGAGVAVSGDVVYYTLNVLPGESVVNQPAPTSAVQQLSQSQPVTFSSLITSTPGPDGAIIHTVQYGETLWTIAISYDVPIDQILTNSGLSQGTTQVFEGQVLIIQLPSDPTPTPTITHTPEPLTPTATQPRPTMTPYPTRTPAPTATPTTPPSALHLALGEGKNVGLGLILVSGLGLILVIYLGFIKKS